MPQTIVSAPSGGGGGGGESEWTTVTLASDVVYTGSGSWRTVSGWSIVCAGNEAIMLEAAITIANTTGSGIASGFRFQQSANIGFLRSEIFGAGTGDGTPNESVNGNNQILGPTIPANKSYVGIGYALFVCLAAGGTLTPQVFGTTGLTLKAGSTFRYKILNAA